VGACMTASGWLIRVYMRFTALPNSSCFEPNVERWAHSAGVIHFWLTTPAFSLSLGNCLAKSGEDLGRGHRIVGIRHHHAHGALEELGVRTFQARVLEGVAHQAVLDDGVAAVQGAELRPELIELLELEALIFGEEQVRERP